MAVEISPLRSLIFVVPQAPRTPRVPIRYGDCYFCKASLTNASRLRISVTISETAIAQDSHWLVSLRSSARERIIWSLLRI